MSRKILMNAENLEQRYDSELPELAEMVNNGVTYIKVEEEQTTFEKIEYWATLEDVTDFNLAYAPEEEEVEELIVADGPFATPQNPTKVAVELRTMTSRINVEELDINRTDCNYYTSKGTLAVYETGVAITSYDDLCAYARNCSGKPVLVYTANKTGN